jgi:hypothetical protein
LEGRSRRSAHFFNLHSLYSQSKFCPVICRVGERSLSPVGIPLAVSAVSSFVPV